MRNLHPLQFRDEAGADLELPESRRLLRRTDAPQIAIHPCGDIPEHDVVLRSLAVPVFPQRSGAVFDLPAPTGKFLLREDFQSIVRVSAIRQHPRDEFRPEDAEIGFVLPSSDLLHQRPDAFRRLALLRQTEIERRRRCRRRFIRKSAVGIGEFAEEGCADLRREFPAVGGIAFFAEQIGEEGGPQHVLVIIPA